MAHPTRKKIYKRHEQAKAFGYGLDKADGKAGQSLIASMPPQGHVSDFKAFGSGKAAVIRFVDKRLLGRTYAPNHPQAPARVTRFASPSPIRISIVDLKVFAHPRPVETFQHEVFSSEAEYDASVDSVVARIRSGEVKARTPDED